MPKGTHRSSSASTSLYTNDDVTDSKGKSKSVPASQTRNFVGDQGAAKVAAARKTVSQDDDSVSSAAAQDTPTQRKAKRKKAMTDDTDELYGKVKTAMTKSGGPLARDSYKDD